MLFHVYSEPKPEGYYVNEPFGIYRTVLDADWLLYLLLPLLLVILIAALMLGWHLHEIPKHKAEKKQMRQAELVSALTLLGLFEHWVWAIALVIAFTDWDAVEDWLVRILQRARAPLDGLLAAAGQVAPVTDTPPTAKPAEVNRAEPTLATAADSPPSGTPPLTPAPSNPSGEGKA
jgi:hypothetical protein